MRPLTFRCPQTDRVIESGIWAARDGPIRSFSLRLRCPACENLHDWHESEGFVRDRSADRLGSARTESRDVFHDLGLSDAEIATYLVHFGTADGG